MKFPNLIAESAYTHPTSMASALGLTTDTMFRILEGELSLSETGKRTLCRYLGRPYGYLFNKELQFMRPDKFQHVQKMFSQMRRLSRTRKIFGRDHNAYTYDRVSNDLWEGLSQGMTYASYLDAVYWVDSACRKARAKERAKEMII